MKIPKHQIHSRHPERGSAVIVTLAMLAIMLLCVGANTIAIRTLSRELKLVEKKQMQRLQHAAPATAAPAKVAINILPAHDSDTPTH